MIAKISTMRSVHNASPASDANVKLRKANLPSMKVLISGRGDTAIGRNHEDKMSNRPASHAPARDRTISAKSPRRQGRTFEQIVAGVRRQRAHIMLLDGADPLRGGVAD